MSIGLLTPNQAHKQRKIKLKTWKKNLYQINDIGSIFVIQNSQPILG